MLSFLPLCLSDSSLQRTALTKGLEEDSGFWITNHPADWYYYCCSLLLLLLLKTPTLYINFIAQVKYMCYCSSQPLYTTVAAVCKYNNLLDNEWVIFFVNSFDKEFKLCKNSKWFLFIMKLFFFLPSLLPINTSGLDVMKITAVLLPSWAGNR